MGAGLGSLFTAGLGVLDVLDDDLDAPDALDDDLVAPEEEEVEELAFCCVVVFFSGSDLRTSSVFFWVL